MKIKLGSLRLPDELQGFVSEFEATVPDGIGDKLGEFGEESVGFPMLLGEVLSVFSARGSELCAFFLFVLGAVMLMSLVSVISGKLGRVAEYAATLIVSVGIFSRIYAVFESSLSAIDGVMRFFTSFIPILTAAIAFGGGGASAAVGGAGAGMTLGIMGAFVIPLLKSCVPLILSLGLVGGTSGLAGRVKSFFLWVTGIASVLLLSSLALQSTIASSSDTAAMRAVKYAASGAIPIVGGSVSSAMGTLAASVGFVKSVIGTGAITVMLLTVLSPLVMLILYRMILSLGEGMLDFLGVGGVRVFAAFRSAVDTLAAVFSLSVTVLIIETAFLMKSGVAV